MGPSTFFPSWWGSEVKNLDLDIDNCNVELQPMPASLSHGAVTIQQPGADDFAQDFPYQATTPKETNVGGGEPLVSHKIYAFSIGSCSCRLKPLPPGQLEAPPFCLWCLVEVLLDSNARWLQNVVRRRNWVLCFVEVTFLEAAI